MPEHTGRSQTLAANSIADPEFPRRVPRLWLQSCKVSPSLEARLRRVDKQIEQLASSNVDPKTKALLETIPRLWTH
jgi:hypothetical protein